MTPHDQTNRPICYKTTDYSAVWQLRDWKPDAIGGVMWVAPSRPCSSAYVPVYDSVTSVPAAWTDATAYNAFRAVADSLDKNGKVNGVRAATSTTARWCGVLTAGSRRPARTRSRAWRRRPPA